MKQKRGHLLPVHQSDEQFPGNFLLRLNSVDSPELKNSFKIIIVQKRDRAPNSLICIMTKTWVIYSWPHFPLSTSDDIMY
ncbi:hypothetical protein KKJ05_21220 [Xenorhabdus bovienii]|nr:hypothetical protein [Xenorhabdus bovienii]